MERSSQFINMHVRCNDATRYDTTNTRGAPALVKSGMWFNRLLLYISESVLYDDGKLFRQLGRRGIDHFSQFQDTVTVIRR